MREYSRTLRIWHWLFAFTIFGMVGTVFLRKTFLSWKANSEIIIAKLSGFNIDITVEQAKAIAKAIRAPMWEWHIILGYLLAILIVYRVAMILQNGFGYDKDSEDLHMRMVHIGYKVLYGLLIIIAISGIVLHNEHSIALSEDIAHEIEEIHEFLSWAIIFFVPAHLIGVVVAEFKKEKGIVSKMISN